MTIMQIMDSKSKIIVLKELIARDASFSISDISRLCSLPKATVSGLILDWEDENLVSCRQIGRNKMVSMNRRFYLLPEIEQMFTKAAGRQQELIKKVRKIKALTAKEVMAVIVFGSRARNDSKSKSDMDLVIVLENDKHNTTENAMEELVKISHETGVTYSPVFITPKDLISRIKERDEFIKNVLTDGKIIKGEKWLEHIQTTSGFGKRKI
ncbi:MAG: nucleotidyltransferase domain-containing protein [Candidatus Diapherotrites archaeon]